MSTELVALLQRLNADQSRLHGLAPEAKHALVASLRLAMGEGESPAFTEPAPSDPPAAWTAADLLTVNEAATMLRVSPRWLYRHAGRLPFARRLSRKVLRFSRVGMARWLATKRL